MLNKIIYTILGFGLAFVFYPHVAHDSSSHAAIAGATTTQISKSSALTAPELALNLSAPALSAKSALAVDLETSTILYSRNLDQQLPIASLTKLMTALIVIDRADLNSIITIKQNDQTVVGTSVGLVAGEQITVGSLLKAMLIPSSNDAALLLATYVGGTEAGFVSLMNDKAVSLELTHTNFTNPVGWDIDDNYSTTLDLIKMVREFLKYPVLTDITATKQTTITSVDGQYTHQLTTTNKLLLDDPEVVGLKTGFTSKALGNLIILDIHQDHRVVSIILGSDNREADSQKLLDWLFAVYKW